LNIESGLSHNFYLLDALQATRAALTKSPTLF
jgi:hypothetical protein